MAEAFRSRLISAAIQYTVPKCPFGACLPWLLMCALLGYGLTAPTAAVAQGDPRLAPAGPSSSLPTTETGDSVPRAGAEPAAPAEPSAAPTTPEAPKAYAAGADATADSSPEEEAEDPAEEVLSEGQLEARSVDALYRLGLTAQRNRQPRRAQRYYDAVLERAPYHVLTHIALGRLHLANDPAIARDHLETARRVHPSSQDVHYLLGQVYEALGRLVDSAESYRRAIFLNPRHYNANARLRKVLGRMREGRTLVERAADAFYAQPSLAALTLFGRLVMDEMAPREAALEFEEVQRRAPELPEAHLWLARARHAQGDVSGEIGAYRSYLEQRPDAAGVRLIVAERLAGQGWYQNAAEILRPFDNGHAMALPPTERARVTFLRSRLLSIQGEPGRAGEQLRLAHEQGYAEGPVHAAFAEDLALYPEAAALWFAYGNWLRAVERPSEAAHALARAGVLDPGHRRKVTASLSLMEERGIAVPATQLALGELAWAEGDEAAALRRLERIPPGDPLDARAALLRGKIHRARGEMDAALDAFTRYVFSFEQREDVLYARGNLFWELGRTEEALAVWMTDPDVLLRHPGVLQFVADHQRSNSDTAGEIATRERLAEAVPTNHQNRIRLGELYAQRGDERTAAMLWDAVLQERPRDADLLARTGKMWLVLHESERALPLLQRASQLRALDVETSALLAGELYRTHRLEDALRTYWVLYQTDSSHPDLPRVLPELTLSLPATDEQRWAAAQLAIRAERPDSATEVLEALLSTTPTHTDARMALAEIYLRQNKAAQAEAVLSAPEAPPGTQERGLELMAEVQERLGRKAALAETLAALHTIRPQDDGLQRKRGLLLAELQRPTEARPLLESASMRAPNDLALLLALAEVASALKDLPAAEGHLDAMLRIEPGHVDARRRMIDLLLRQSRWQEASARLETWVEENPRDATARYNLISAYLKQFEPERARPHYEVLQRANPRRARSLAPYFR